MRGFQTKLDVIGNNIANVNTVGFKSGRVMFKDIMSQTTSGASAPGEAGQGGVNPKQIGLGSSVASIDTLFMNGSAMTTNKKDDLRLDGDGFFLVNLGDDQETPFLTRAGNFTKDTNGNLLTSDGLRVLDTGNTPIVIDPAATAFSISPDGFIVQTMPDGTIANGQQLGIAKIANPQGLEKIGGNLYRMTLNANPEGTFETTTANNAETGTGAVVSGELEMSNVDLTGEFTEMIVAQRGFQANSRIITTSDEVLQEVVNLKR